MKGREGNGDDRLTSACKELFEGEFPPTMTDRTIRVLLVDDDEEDCLITRDLLDEIEGKRFELDWVDHYEVGLERISQRRHDVYLLDYRLGARSGLDLLAKVRELACDVPVIILTGQGDVDVDLAAQQAGASDYLVKRGLDAATLDRSIRYSLQQAEMLSALARERANLAQRVEERTRELSLANAELARANRAKDDFLANMSHELRTPLTGILAMSEILGEQLYGPLSEKQLDFTQNIHNSGRHLLDLINDILDVAKVESGKLDLVVGPVDMNRLCQAAMNLIKQTAMKRNLKASLEIETDADAFLGDEKRLKQVLVNLLGNAIKFTPAGGKVGLTVEDNSERNELLFTVWDTGIGIGEEQQGRLFQPFVQLDSSLSRKYAGTGLGLVLVERLTHLHGGYVTLQSEEGKGSRFTVAIPWRAEAMQIGAEEPIESVHRYPSLLLSDIAAPIDESAPLLLFVDDDSRNVQLYSEYLRTKGFRVETAGNGREAVEQALCCNPDLILMDVQMPEVDGLTAMRRLRADKKFKTTPIIALTALAMEGDREKCLEAGADRYLSKPVPLKRLITTIGDMLNDDRRKR